MGIGLAERRVEPGTLIVSAHALSNLADGIRLAAFPLIVFTVTNSALWVSATFAAGLAPSVLVGLHAGATADRVDRHRLLRRVVAARAMLLVGLACAVWADAASPWLVVAVAALFGVGEAFTDTTMGALVPAVVEPAQLERVNSRMVTVEIIGNELAGPAIGSALFAIVAWLPFISGGAALGLAMAMLAGLSWLSPTRDEIGPDVDETDGSIRSGVRYVWRSRQLRNTTLATSLLVGIDSAWFALLVVLVTDELGLDESAFGVILALGAVGGILGAWLAPRFFVVGLSRLAVGVFVSVGASLLAVWASPSTLATVIALTVSSAGFALWNVTMTSTRQAHTPLGLLGRSTSVHRTAAMLASLVGAIGGGWIATTTNIVDTVGVAALALLLTTPFVAMGLRGMTADSG